MRYATGRSDVKAAYLIDPVDNTKFTPESSQYPSAVKALQRSGKPVGLTGAGVVGSCNPKGSNFQACPRAPCLCKSVQLPESIDNLVYPPMEKSHH